MDDHVRRSDLITDSRPTLVLWADTGSGIGAGHLMRMVAIAQAWTDCGGRAILLAVHFQDSMLAPHVSGIDVHRLYGSVLPVVEQARAVACIAAECRADWIAVDGYRFDDSVENVLATAGCPLMALDDLGTAAHSAAELVVCPHGDLGAESTFGQDRLECSRYRSKWEIAGLKFVPVRREFQGGGQARKSPAGDEPIRMVVTMGGADPANMTERVCRAIAAARASVGVRLDVILGSDYRHRAGLQSWLNQSGLCAEVHVQVPDPGRIFSRADLAVSAGGSTLYDLACLGVPAIAVEIAGNQRPVIRSMIDAGCAWAARGGGMEFSSSIGEMIGELVLRPDLLQRMRESGPAAVDGRGAARIVRRMLAGKLVCRPAVAGDFGGLWRLRNDPLVRANSRSTDAVELAGHRIWLDQVLADDRRHLFVLENGAEKIVGQCRLDIDADDASGTISVSLMEELRGCSVAAGFVSVAVRQILAMAAGAKPLQTLVAWIRPENRASRQLFTTLGFVASDPGNRGGEQLLLYRRQLPANQTIAAGGGFHRRLITPQARSA